MLGLRLKLKFVLLMLLLLMLLLKMWLCSVISERRGNLQRGGIVNKDGKARMATW
jgi:hypothetical protein